MSAILSKSDFQLASTCVKKLVYKKAAYPTSNDGNEYMEMLAQGGYIIGKMACLYYPQGIEIEDSTAECLALTTEWMKQENVVLFEPAFLSGQKLVRIDILVKEGRNLHLIEVKAKSFDSSEKKKDKKLEKYIDDVAYQYLVLSECFPDYNITTFLFLPDKSKHTEIDGLAGWFSILPPLKEEEESEVFIARQKPRFRRPEVVFRYEHHPEREKYISELKTNGILNLLDVTADVLARQPGIAMHADFYLSVLNSGIKPTDYNLTKECKSCEFATSDDEKNGFAECWGRLAEVSPHIFELYYGGTLKTPDNEFLLNRLIREKKVSLFDIQPDDLRKKDGDFGVRAERQLLQIENTKTQSEWISPQLSSIVESFEYPLHFIDFETYSGAVPGHKGMRPYEVIAFQWSCHSLSHSGAQAVHNEWIHTGPMFPDGNCFPNFEFAHSLMKYIGYTGTPFMWATHENTILRTVLNQMEQFDYKDDELREWLLYMTHDKGREGRLVDMNKLTVKHYFHPAMKGKTSIKKVLPALWTHFPYLHSLSQFRVYAPETHAEGILDPYDMLTKGVEVQDIEEEAVSTGTDAMRAYQRIRYDDALSAEQKEEIRRQLLEYCKLDTLAMVIIGYHWGMR